MSQIYPAVKESDVVVLATPLYYWNMSGQIRTAIDRLFALEEGDGNLLRGHERASALLMAAEGMVLMMSFYTITIWWNICAGKISSCPCRRQWGYRRYRRETGNPESL